MSDTPLPHVALFEAMTCRGCGAPLDPGASEDGYLECAYCGARFADPRAAEPPPEPEIVLIRESELPLSLPSQYDEAAARSRVHAFLKKGLFAPSDLAEQAQVGTLAWSLVPTWTGAATTISRWTAEVGRKKGDKVAWRNVKGQRQHHYADLYAVAGPEVWRSGPPEKAVVAAQPLFAQARRDHYLKLQSNQIVPTRMSKSAAASHIEGLLKRLERKACRREVGGGRVRSFRADTTIQEIQLEMLHVPVWHGHYGYRDKEFAVYVNAATGRTYGKRPLSARRVGIALAILAVLVVIAGVVQSRRNAEKQKAARRRAQATRLETQKKRAEILSTLRRFERHPSKRSDAEATTIFRLVGQLEGMGGVPEDVRELAVQVALQRASRRLTLGRPAQAANAFKRASRLCAEGGDGKNARCQSVLRSWTNQARKSYTDGYRAYQAKKLYAAERHLRSASALLAPLARIAALGSAGTDLKILARSAKRMLRAVQDALKKRYNTTLRLILFNDKDGDPWDRDDAPDPEATIEIGGRRTEVREQVGKDRFEIKVPLELTDGAKVRIAVRERDGGERFEKVGTAEGTYRRGRPLWLRAGWAYVQVLTRHHARRLRFKTFVAQARQRQRKDRLASWASTLVPRGESVRFAGSEIRIVRKRRYRTYRSKAADKAFCGKRLLRAPGGGTFVVLRIRQKVVGVPPRTGLRKDRFFGGVTAVLATADGQKLMPYPALATCLYKGSQQVLQTRQPGQSWEVLLPFAVPKDTLPRDLYLQLTGPALSGGQTLTRRLRLW